MYYIEGTIDSIKIEIGKAESVCFTLHPSAEFLKTVAEGAKKALFVEKSGKTALIAEFSENGNEKGKRDFKLGSADSAIKCLLLEAKNNRNTVRVVVESRAKLCEPVSITIL